ncbi:hypothetical protein EZV61_12415 [Corallincola luteus]|uniref:Uncharacterized protein n=1 Tax=Corallincola luteus TaxID=1775177 RepID=A0ABY2AIQ9_9GAMM|nr:VpsP family polysaccharide biosynthesis protein [Corallincola luteus]TCI02601.1 hypothetical protein EZV61_12415 [Corallincola luteus]
MLLVSSGMKDDSIRLALFSALLLALVVAFWTSAKWGIANINAVYAERKLNKWSHQKAVSDNELSLVTASVERAVDLHSDNAHYVFLQAKLLEWLAYQQPQSADLFLQQALASLNRSLLLRQGWPNTWLSVASVKHRMGQYDADYSKAMRRAAALGPYKQDVTLGLIQIGFETWSHSDVEMKKALLEAIKRGLSRSATGWQVIALAKQYDKLSIVCTVHRRQKTASALPTKFSDCR